MELSKRRAKDKALTKGVQRFKPRSTIALCLCELSNKKQHSESHLRVVYRSKAKEIRSYRNEDYNEISRLYISNLATRNLLLSMCSNLMGTCVLLLPSFLVKVAFDLSFLLLLALAV